MLDLNTYSSRIRHDLTEINGKPLPARGFIAGSAVSKLLWSYVHGGNYPINSIDVFIEEVNPQPDTSLSPLRISGYYINDAYRQATLSKIGYKVLKISRVGVIKQILIRKNEPVFGDDNKRYAVILDGFSLNCYMAGIDTLSGKVFWTKKFERFLQDGQLQVTCPVTPYQTTILLPHIRQELGCYVNLRDEIGLLASYERACRMDDLYDSYAGSFSAKRYLQLFQTHLETLSPFCQLLEFTPAVLPGMEAFMDSRFALDYDVALLNHQAIDNLMRRATDFDSYSFSMCYDHIVRSSSSKKCRDRFIMGISWGGIPTLAIMLNPASAQSDLQKKQLACVEIFSKKHPACTKRLLDMKMTIQAQYKAIRLLRKMSREKGEIVYGLVENAQHLGGITEISEDVVNALFETFMSKEGESLTEPVNLDNYRHKDSVTELTTSAQLAMESSLMRHCIQSYSSAVKERECRVFHIFKNGRHSTAAIYPDCEFEIHSAHNRAAPPDHVEIADSLSRVLWKCFEQGENLAADFKADDAFLDSV